MCQKLKTWSNFFGWKIEINHERNQMLLSRYGFFQQALKEQ